MWLPTLGFQEKESIQNFIAGHRNQRLVEEYHTCEIKDKGQKRLGYGQMPGSSHQTWTVSVRGSKSVYSAKAARIRPNRPAVEAPILTLEPALDV